mmetsp:Transcript_27388/g.81167  ORF Transcript_27388/g.81167 Transcript_27388/m.81167 type:complete len:201 (-) Transcript_27388:294-896(-)
MHDHHYVSASFRMHQNVSLSGCMTITKCPFQDASETATAAVASTASLQARLSAEERRRRQGGGSSLLVRLSRQAPVVKLFCSLPSARSAMPTPRFSLHGAHLKSAWWCRHLESGMRGRRCAARLCCPSAASLPWRAARAGLGPSTCRAPRCPRAGRSRRPLAEPAPAGRLAAAWLAAPQPASPTARPGIQIRQVTHARQL